MTDGATFAPTELGREEHAPLLFWEYTGGEDIPIL